MNPLSYNTVVFILFVNAAFLRLFAVATDATEQPTTSTNNQNQVTNLNQNQETNLNQNPQTNQSTNPTNKNVIIDISKLHPATTSGYKRTTVANEDEITPQDGYVITKVVDNGLDIFTADNNKIVRIYIPKLTTSKIVDIVLSDMKHCCFEKQDNAYVGVSLFDILRNRDSTRKYTIDMEEAVSPISMLSLKNVSNVATVPFNGVVENIMYGDEVIMDDTNFYLTGAAAYRKDNKHLIRACFITKDNKRGEKYFMKKPNEESYSEVSIKEGVKFMHEIDNSFPADYVPESNGFMNVALYFMLVVSTALFVF